MPFFLSLTLDPFYLQKMLRNLAAILSCNVACNHFFSTLDDHFISLKASKHKQKQKLQNLFQAEFCHLGK